jgi:hypothetical protein
MVRVLTTTANAPLLILFLQAHIPMATLQFTMRAWEVRLLNTALALP